MDDDEQIYCHIAAQLGFANSDEVASWKPEWSTDFYGNIIVRWPNGRPDLVDEDPTTLDPMDWDDMSDESREAENDD